MGTSTTRAKSIIPEARRVASSNPTLGYAVVIPLALLAEAASAHVDAPPAGPAELWATWSIDPFLLTVLVAVGVAYAAGVRRLWLRAGRGRGIAVWQAASFSAGMAVLALALVSPLDGLGEALFSAHMAQHILLTAAVPPLLLLGRPMVLIWAFPSRTRAALGTWLRRGIVPRLGAPVAWPTALSRAPQSEYEWHRAVEV